MRFEYLFVFLLGQLCHHQVTCDDEALRECANIHHISIQVIPNVHATFTNHKCLLNCLVDNKTLASDPINEGVACPLDSTGICKNGQCIGGQEEAIGECSKMHSLDFHLVRNSGTLYVNSLCQLKCVIDGNVIGLHAINEGLQCPKDFNGVCRNGQCVTTSTASTTSPTTAPTTAPATAPTTAPTTAPITAPTELHVYDVPIEVTFTRAESYEKTKNIFQVQVCFLYTKPQVISWNSCDLTWTSGIIHGNITHREGCFTIQRYTLQSAFAVRIFYNSYIYRENVDSFSAEMIETSHYEWFYYDGSFRYYFENQKIHVQ